MIGIRTYITNTTRTWSNAYNDNTDTKYIRK